MIKLLLLIIFAGLVYVGMNWEEQSGEIDKHISAFEDVKSQMSDLQDKTLEWKEDAMALKENVMNDDAASRLEEAKNKIEALRGEN